MTSKAAEIGEIERNLSEERENDVLLTLVIAGVVSLVWICLFAWIKARTIGLI